MNPTPYLDARIAFTLGEDFAFFGLPVPAGADQAMLQGHNTGHARFPRRQPADRFVKKWLQIRVGAWKRNRVFESTVTPDYLQQLDNAVCPITGVTLTHATGLDTDRSIDRLNNDGAYARGNLLVMSSRVNLIKGSLSWQEIQRYAEADQNALGLTNLEWRKLWRVVSSSVAEICMLVREGFSVEELPRGLLSGWSLNLQHQLVHATKAPAKIRAGLWERFRTSAGSKRAIVDDLSWHLQAYAKSTPEAKRCAAELFRDAAAWSAFSKWWEVFKVSADFISLANYAYGESVKHGLERTCTDEIVQGFSLNTKGYN